LEIVWRRKCGVVGAERSSRDGEWEWHDVTEASAMHEDEKHLLFIPSHLQILTAHQNQKTCQIDSIDKSAILRNPWFVLDLEFQISSGAPSRVASRFTLTVSFGHTSFLTPIARFLTLARLKLSISVLQVILEKIRIQR